MSNVKYNIYKAGFGFLYYTKLHKILSGMHHARGMIFTLHQVNPFVTEGFAPNNILKITPDFLDQVITTVKEQGYDLLSLDEAAKRLHYNSGDKFVCFTLDDGYRDNLQYAYSVFKKHDCPFTIYIPTAYPDGMGELWWLALEDVIRNQEAIAVDLGMGRDYLDCGTEAQKWQTYDILYQHCRALSEIDQRKFIRALCNDYGVDLAEMCRELIMNWEEVNELSQSDLCTIGAHTVHHYELSKLDRAHATLEMREGANIIKAQTGIWPKHFSFPYGGTGAAGKREFEIAKELGFTTAVTTRPGAIYTENRDYMTALPRVSLNGKFQSAQYLEVMLGGGVFSAMNGFKTLNVA